MITLPVTASVQNIPVPKKDETAKPQQKAEQTQPYKTRAGITTGAIYAAPGTILLMSMNKIMNSVKNILDEAVKSGAPAELKAEIPKFKPYIAVPIFLASTLGCGLFIDKKINDKNAKLAENLKTKSKETIYKDEDNIEKTKNGNLYHKSKIGKNIGPILGAVVMVFNSTVSALIHKKPINMNFIKLIDGLATGALGGLILGSITDHFANKGAKAHADVKLNK